MQTLLLACPTAHLLDKAAAGSGGCGGGSENSSAAPNCGEERPPNVVVLHCITEKVCCTDLAAAVYQQACWLGAGG